MGSLFMLCTAFLASVSAFTSVCPDTTHNTFAVTQSGNVFNILGLGNPSLTLKAGCDYQFSLDATVTAFHIRPTPTGTDDASIVGNGMGGPTTLAVNIANTSSAVFTTAVDDAVYGNINVTANAVSCPQYCSDLRVACFANGADVYASQQECEAACAVLPSDPAFNTGGSGDSWQCRSEQALAAATSAGGAACGNAGFLGGWDVFSSAPGQCSTVIDYCETLCQVSSVTCTGDNSLFRDNAECRSLCLKWATVGDANTTNDSYYCRLNAVKASTLSASSCSAASLLGGNVCGSSCLNYCNVRSPFCAEAFPNCLTACAALPYNGPLVGFGTGHNLQCFYANVFSGFTASACNTDPLCPIPSSSGFPSSSPFSSSVAASSSAPFSSSGIHTSGAREMVVGFSGVLAVLLLVVAL